MGLLMIFIIGKYLIGKQNLLKSNKIMTYMYIPRKLKVKLSYFNILYGFHLLFEQHLLYNIIKKGCKYRKKKQSTHWQRRRSRKWRAESFHWRHEDVEVQAWCLINEKPKTKLKNYRILKNLHWNITKYNRYWFNIKTIVYII